VGQELASGRNGTANAFVASAKAAAVRVSVTWFTAEKSANRSPSRLARAYARGVVPSLSVPEGGFRAFIGRHGKMNPAGRVRGRDSGRSSAPQRPRLRTHVGRIRLLMFSGYRSDCTTLQPVGEGAHSPDGRETPGTEQLHNIGLDDGVGGKIMGFSFAAKLRP
jgi:hypothetical protein